jgi:alanyl-tRNA synthetase
MVRVVEIGGEYSTELFGGCHVCNTSDICFFKIIGESSITSRVRPVEAITGEEAFKMANSQYDQIPDLAKIFSCPPCDFTSRVSAFMEKSSALESEVKEPRAKLIAGWHP